MIAAVKIVIVFAQAKQAIKPNNKIRAYGNVMDMRRRLKKITHFVQVFLCIYLKILKKQLQNKPESLRVALSAFTFPKLPSVQTSNLTRLITTSG